MSIEELYSKVSFGSFLDTCSQKIPCWQFVWQPSKLWLEESGPRIYMNKGRNCWTQKAQCRFHSHWYWYACNTQTGNLRKVHFCSILVKLAWVVCNKGCLQRGTAGVQTFWGHRHLVTCSDPVIDSKLSMPGGNPSIAMQPSEAGTGSCVCKRDVSVTIILGRCWSAERMNKPKGSITLYLVDTGVRTRDWPCPGSREVDLDR